MSHNWNPIDETTHLLPLTPSAPLAADADASIIPPPKGSQCPQQRPPKKPCVYWLTVTMWISGAIFGSFALLHYIRRYYIPYYACTTDGDDDDDNINETCTTQSAWDRTDPNLYRPTHPIANRVMVTHLMGGVFLMVAGPFQLLKRIRQQWNMGWHRWVGRVYIFAALLASSCATIWTLVWRTSRCNIHEDVGNVIFGVAVFTSAVQTFRYIVAVRGGASSSSRRCIRSHKLWAWRLYACVLGAPLYRLYNTIYGAAVLYTPWKGSLFVENAIFYTTVIPGLIVVQILWRRIARQERQIVDADNIAVKEELEGVPDRSANQPPLQLVKSVWIQISLVFVVVTTFIIFSTLWLPAILGRDPGVVADIYHDFCNG